MALFNFGKKKEEKGASCCCKNEIQAKIAHAAALLQQMRKNLPALAAKKKIARFA